MIFTMEDIKINWNLDKKLDLLGRCKECRKINNDIFWCQSCNSKHFNDEAKHWRSDNKRLDQLILKRQVDNARDRTEIIEWIPYERFVNVKIQARGYYSTVYSAQWKPILKRDIENNKWKRYENLSITVSLKELHATKLSDEFLDEVIIVFSFI